MTTTASLEEAETIATALLSEKLAACIQTWPIQSRYVWKDELVREAETMVLIKTRAALFEAVRSRVKALHSYETPEIVALPVVEAAPSYAAWLARATRHD
jgi:periplasmic divalent cation tolerance protein